MKTRKILILLGLATTCLLGACETNVGKATEKGKFEGEFSFTEFIQKEVKISETGNYEIDINVKTNEEITFEIAGEKIDETKEVTIKKPYNKVVHLKKGETYFVWLKKEINDKNAIGEYSIEKK